MSNHESSHCSLQPSHESNDVLSGILSSSEAATMNAKSTRHGADIPLSFHTTPRSEPLFKSNTIAPSPPARLNTTTSNAHDSLSPFDASSRPREIEAAPQSSPLSAGLRIQTDLIPNYTVTEASAEVHSHLGSDNPLLATRSMNAAPLARTPSVKNIFASSLGSAGLGSAPNSAISSPMLNAMADVTPLPSPLMSNDSPGPWRKLGARPGSREAPMPITPDTALVTSNGESISVAIANQSKRRAYHGLTTAAHDSGLTNAQISREKIEEGHVRNRSVSEYTPETVQLPKTRQITVSGTHAQVSDVVTPIGLTTLDTNMRREPHLAVQRGLSAIPKPPTPPSSRAGGEGSDSDSPFTSAALPRTHRRHEYFDAFSREDARRRRWRALKVLGQGTFSKVMLATSEITEHDDRIDENNALGLSLDGGTSPIESEAKIDLRKLVAVKICEHGPKGGASEERVEMSLKRELEIMKSINHPSLVHLKAWSIEETRAILVLSYCPGGDLFEVASERRGLLVPGLLRRMFSELVGAVRYLHERHIVHRDIKLENVLVNLPPQELARSLDWTTYPYSVITLTDLGLSRRVADDEKLTTRCGSDDYAAPEVIMGQPYDGRATDAWSLGVLLYALLESRLPFDPNPGMSEGHKQRSRTSHRIARVEWRWIEYAGDDGDHEGNLEKFKERALEGAMLVTEGLLKRARSRWSMEKVADEEWVRGGMCVEGGVQFREEEPAAEVDGEEMEVGNDL